MSVRIFPPSDEQHDDFEFHLDKFMGKWSVAFSFIVLGNFLIFFGRYVTHSTLPLWKVSAWLCPRGTAYLHLYRTKRT